MFSLYPFQETGARWLADRDRWEYTAGGPDAGYLADDMGLGKTEQAVRAAALVDPDRTLLYAPASALANWESVWAERGTGELVPVSYAARTRPAGRFDVAILDEAHYCKTPGALRTRRAFAVARDAGRVWLLSGTPAPNHVGELYAPIAAFWPMILGELGIRSHAAWIRRFCRYNVTRWGVSIYGNKNLDTLAPYLSRIFLRRTAADVGLELPPLRATLSLLPNDARLDDALRATGEDPDRLRTRMEREEAADDGSTSRLRRLLGEYKAPLIADMIAGELAAGAYRKIVVLAHHRSVLDILRKTLSRFGVAYVDGSTPRAKRASEVDLFTANDATRVFLAQQDSAGVALNLQAASEIVLVEPSWGDNVQLIKRVHRIGQTDHVRARVFGVAKTLDEALMRVVVRKLKMRIELGL